MKRLIKGLSLALLAAGLVSTAAQSAQPLAAPPPQTHLGGKASAILQLITPTSPVFIGERLVFIVFDRDGAAQPDFELPRNSVLVVTDVMAYNCRGAPGRYVAGVFAPGSPRAKIPIYFDTTVDGETRLYHFASGVVFSALPEVEVSTLSVADLCVESFGYLVKNQ